MHASSLENMQRCFEQHVLTRPWPTDRPIEVLDVGGADVNGSYADIFSQPPFNYVAADIDAAPGVSLVLDDPYALPLADGSLDLVISGQAFEHVEFFWLLFAEMVRVLRPRGLILLVAPSAGPIHRYPVDCYRFYPDAYAALAKYAECELMDVWRDDRGPWNDLVGVFGITPADATERSRPVGWELNRYEAQGQPIVRKRHSTWEDDPRERLRGERPYRHVLGDFHRDLRPRGYLEIGVREGASFELASCPSFGIDPDPAPSVQERLGSSLFVGTSDAFFTTAEGELLNGVTLDMAFIDGMHLFEYALRDFINVERHAHHHTVVIVDDVHPNHPDQASRDRTTAAWTGDVWKLGQCLQEHRKDLLVLSLDTAPSGMLLIYGLNPKDTTLQSQYNPLVRTYRDEREITDPTASDWLERTKAVSPSATDLQTLLTHIRSRRERATSEHKARADARSVVRWARGELFER